MPGPFIPNQTPDWLKPENASVTDSALTQAMRRIGHLIGADNPTSQVLGLMMSEIPTGPNGGIAGALERLSQKAQTFIKAYHGSPHDFEQFSTARIGSGEGAQAYGHGLYFAENPETAQAYRASTAPQNFGFPDRDPRAGIAMILASKGDQGEEIARRAYQSLGPSLDPAIEEAKQAVLQRSKMYEVAIKADPSKFLDWEKPLSEQPLSVQKSVLRLLKPNAQERYMMSGGYWNPPPREAMTGGEAYQHIADRLKQDEGIAGTNAASLALKQKGIPGIKYLDQGSRGTTGGELIDVSQQGGQWFAKIRKPNVSGGLGNASADMFTTSMPLPSKEAATKWATDQINQGTRNYVVFDDSLVDILKKYGVAGAAIEGLRRKAQAQGGSVTQDDVASVQ